jgi:hypothetical protein
MSREHLIQGMEGPITCVHPSEESVANCSLKPWDADVVNHPSHYTSHPSGIECIDVTRHMGFNLGNVIKYVWRCDLKADEIQDLEKALWYLQDEIAMRKKAADHG